jgi:uncharacterized protein YbjT (DUF2867 family)
MYVITGASGNTGSAAADQLLARREKVRVIGRNAAHLERFAKKGAEVVTADVTNAEALAKAFEGATGVYLMVPPDITTPDVVAHYDRIGDSLARAVEKAGVTKAVALSSIGADKPDKVGPVVGVHDLEQKLAGVRKLDVVFLRAGYFMENLLPQVNLIKMFGFVGGPLRADLPLPLIATRDIGARAAELLARHDFKGRQTRELLGQRDLNYQEIAQVIGKAIGRPELGYKQLPASQVKPAMVQMGMSEGMAGALVEMSDSMNSGYMKPLEKRSPENTTPTSIETFLTEKFVPLFRGASAGAG